MENTELILTYAGMDIWDRSVYKEPCGRLWKADSPTKYTVPQLCTSV